MPPDNRLSIRVDPDVAEVLARVDDARAYLESLVRHRRREWQGAYARLTSGGWSSEHLRAACDALNGYDLTLWHPEGRELGVGIALELHDAQRLNDVCRQHGADADVWARSLVPAVGTDLAVARDLATLAREFWGGDQEVARRMGVGS